MKQRIVVLMFTIIAGVLSSCTSTPVFTRTNPMNVKENSNFIILRFLTDGSLNFADDGPEEAHIKINDTLVHSNEVLINFEDDINLKFKVHTRQKNIISVLNTIVIESRIYYKFIPGRTYLLRLGADWSGVSVLFLFYIGSTPRYYVSLYEYTEDMKQLNKPIIFVANKLKDKEW